MTVSPLLKPERTSPASDSAPATSVLKALRILECFAGVTGPLGVSEVARRAEVPKSTAFRLLAFLAEAEFVERVGRGYQLGEQVLQLGRQVGHARYRALRVSAVPFMNELVGRGQGIAVLSVLEGSTVRTIEQAHGTDLARVAEKIPLAAPYNCSAAGKVIAAFSGQTPDAGALPSLTEHSVIDGARLKEQVAAARREGVARECMEMVLGVGSVAAPVLVEGRPVAALSLHLPAASVGDALVAKRVAQVAEAIGRHHTRARGR